MVNWDKIGKWLDGPAFSYTRVDMTPEEFVKIQELLGKKQVTVDDIKRIPKEQIKAIEAKCELLE